MCSGLWKEEDSTTESSTESTRRKSLCFRTALRIDNVNEIKRKAYGYRTMYMLTPRKEEDSAKESELDTQKEPLL